MKVFEALRVKIEGEIPCLKCGSTYIIKECAENLTIAYCASCHINDTIELKFYNGGPLISIDLPHYRVKITLKFYCITSYGAGDMATVYYNGATTEIADLDVLELDSNWVKTFLAFL